MAGMRLGDLLRLMPWLLAGAGCADLPVPRLVDPPPGREQVRSLAVVVEAPVPPPAVTRPVSGPLEGFLYGSARGRAVGGNVAVQFAQPIARAGDPLSIFVWMALGAGTVTVCTVGGAIMGPFQSKPKDEVRRRIATIEQSLLGVDLANDLDVRLGSEIRVARPGLVRVAASKAPDATLTARITGYGLIGSGGFDPQVSIAMHVETHWKTADQDHRAAFLYRGPKRSLVDWSDHTTALDEELRRACQQLATRIAEERLLVEVAQ
jgi:hypothetical protein